MPTNDATVWARHDAVRLAYQSVHYWASDILAWYAFSITIIYGELFAESDW